LSSSFRKTMRAFHEGEPRVGMTFIAFFPAYCEARITGHSEPAIAARRGTLLPSEGLAFVDHGRSKNAIETT